MMKSKMMAAGGATKMAKMQAGGGVKAKMAPSKMGTVKTSPKPDGVAKKGLTKGKMVGMRGR
jgi:hypothetical protein